MEGGIVKFIKVYENIKYEILVDVLDVVDILMDGVDLQVFVNYIVQIVNVGGLYFFGWLFINLEGISFNVQINMVYLRVGVINIIMLDEWFIKNIGGSFIIFII